MQQLPDEINNLIKQREEARNQGDYAHADKLRDEILKHGYLVEDTAEGMRVTKPTIKGRYLSVFGSGEISSVGRSIHEYVLEQMGLSDVTIGIISTPAGFQPNCVTVHEEIKTFFLEHLTNFHPTIKILYVNTRKDASDPVLIEEMKQCQYLFMGPGSPTYAVKTLNDTPFLASLLEHVSSSASLSLSSAAALAFSNYCLPVYEIYKVGSELHWVEGLHAYEALIKQPLSVVPHFNNTEGGEKNDTSHCFMGEKRFGDLKKLLEEKTAMIGIDEQTARVWDLTTGMSDDKGKGKVTTL